MKIKYLIIILIIMSSIACSGKAKKNNLLPVDELIGLDGKKYNLSAVYNKVMIINFWASWCVPSQKEIAHLKKIYERYQNQDLMIFGITLEDPDIVHGYQEQAKIPYPIILGTPDLFRKLEVKKIPRTIFIDKKGRIRKIQTGFTPALNDDYDALVDSLIKESGRKK